MERDEVRRRLNEVEAEIVKLGRQLLQRKTYLELMARMQREPKTEVQDVELDAMAHTLIALGSFQRQLLTAFLASGPPPR